MNRLYYGLILAVLMMYLPACSDNQQSAEVSESKQETVVAVPMAQSVFAVQEAVSGDLPAVPVEPGHESIPPADQPLSAGSSDDR